MINQKLTYTFVFDRKKKSKETGKGLIEMVVYFGLGKRKYISSKIKITPDQWNQKKQVINSKNLNFVALNAHLKKMRDSIEKVEMEENQKGKQFTKQNLDDHLSGKLVPKTFNQFYELMRDSDNKLKPGILRDHKRTLDILNQFNPEIHFSELNFEMIHLFDTHLRAMGFKQGTIWKHHRNVKKYINLAINYEFFDISKYPYKNFKVEKAQPKNIYLNYSELEKIENLKIDSIPSMEMIRKRFLFSCYTGLRISDNSRLTGSDFILQEHGIGLKLDRMYKVDRRIHLKLWELFDGKPQTLIAPFLTDDLTAPVWPIYIPDATFNKGLKIIQKEAKINKLLTSHVARHTFGTLLAHKTGSIFEVMKSMGISKFETAQIYIDLSEEL